MWNVLCCSVKSVASTEHDISESEMSMDLMQRLSCASTASNIPHYYSNSSVFITGVTGKGSHAFNLFNSFHFSSTHFFKLLKSQVILSNLAYDIKKIVDALLVLIPSSAGLGRILNTLGFVNKLPFCFRLLQKTQFLGRLVLEVFVIGLWF